MQMESNAKFGALDTHIPLTGAYYIKAIDLLFIVGGVLVLLLLGGILGVGIGMALILAGILGIVTGWDD